jgi:hypothetical protein
MAAGRCCGNCRSFNRIKDWIGTKSGLCEILDKPVNVDSTCAKKCRYYKRLKVTKKEDSNHEQ